MSEKGKKIAKWLGIAGIILVIGLCMWLGAYRKVMLITMLITLFLFNCFILPSWFCFEKYKSKKEKSNAELKEVTKSATARFLSVLVWSFLYITIFIAIIYTICFFVFTCTCPHWKLYLSWFMILALLIVFMLLTVLRKKVIYLVVTLAVTISLPLGSAIVNYSACECSAGVPAGNWEGVNDTATTAEMQNQVQHDEGVEEGKPESSAP